MRTTTFLLLSCAVASPLALAAASSRDVDEGEIVSDETDSTRSQPPNLESVLPCAATKKKLSVESLQRAFGRVLINDPPARELIYHGQTEGGGPDAAASFAESSYSFGFHRNLAVPLHHGSSSEEEAAAHRAPNVPYSFSFHRHLLAADEEGAAAAGLDTRELAFSASYSFDDSFAFHRELAPNVPYSFEFHHHRELLAASSSSYSFEFQGREHAPQPNNRHLREAIGRSW